MNIALGIDLDGLRLPSTSPEPLFCGESLSNQSNQYTRAG
jgi:hypothetical protein